MRIFKCFVPEPFLRRIASKGLNSIRVGYNEPTELTVLFSDIRGFTSIAEMMPPAELLTMLNSYFTALSAPIHQHQGFIDKFIGDAIMAIFEGPQHALNAVNAAMAMQEALEKWNIQAQRPLKSGIGLHSGMAVIGTVGTASRMDSTVLGDSVNLAARLESLTKEHGHPIIVSENTLQLAQASGAHTWQAEHLGNTMVKGRHESPNYWKIF